MTDIANKTCESCKRVYTVEADFLHNTSQWRVCSEGNLWFNCDCATSLMIPKGRFAWYAPDKLMGPEARSVFNKLAASRELPHIPAIIMDLQQKIQDSSIDPKSLSLAVRNDPILASNILKIASNLANLRARDRIKIRSLEHSIICIGQPALTNLVVAASISSFKIPTKHFKIKHFWDASIVSAGIAEILAGKFSPLLKSDEVYLSACLANIGKIMSALCFPTETDLIFQESSNLANQKTWQECEQKYENIDHCILGEIGASLWGLPKYVTEAARFHHEPISSDKIEPGKATLIEIVQFAVLLTPWLFEKLGYCESDKVVKMAERFNLNEAELSNLAVELQGIKPPRF